MRRGRLRRAGRRWAPWLGVVALVAPATAGPVLAVATATPAGADPIGDCSATTGVIVAVDFAAWGGNIERGCDVTLTTGYHALHVAGFTTSGDAQDGPGFICRIDDEPPPSEDPCVTTPPADAYWSYWHADAGQNTWTYSAQGATSYQPPPGSVDAWTFGSTDIDGTNGQPSFPPSAVRATGGSGPGSGSSTTTTPATTVTTTTASSVPERTSPATPPPTIAPASSHGSSHGSSPGSSPSITSAPGGGAGHHPATSAAGSPTSPTPSPVAPTAPAAATRRTPKIVDAVPAVTHRPSAGSAVPLLVGAGIAVALAAAAGAAAWRRRRIG
jgi:hypothetical protein